MMRLTIATLKVSNCTTFYYCINSWIINKPNESMSMNLQSLEL
jgi:hypothetical protein